MFWADKIAKEIIKSRKYTPYWVDDMKTPSGRVHVGALRGVMIHDFVYKSLKNQKKEAKYTYVFNDMDTMDGLPSYLDKEKYLKHMGEPLYKIPAPDGSDNFAKYYGEDFIRSIHKMGAYPEFIWSSDLYRSGKMNEAIKLALDNADIIRDIYKDIANYQHPNDWFPFQPICEKCGKQGTTTAYAWDGEFISYRCEENKVDWAQGCGHQGKVSPYNGNGKLLWKVDWPAHWKTLGITIEGAGKDHSSAGGSRDMAKQILAKVFHYPNPFDIPYEWFVIKGAKMSSSKGIGTPASEFVDILPSEIARFLFARTNYNTVLDFNPYGDTIPDLFDEYDRCAEHFFTKKGDDFARIYEVSQLSDKFLSENYYRPRFRKIAQYLQLPGVDVFDKVSQEKGNDLTKLEREVVSERIDFAKIWLKKYAPAEKVLNISQEIPDETQEFNNKQKQYLAVIINLINKDWQDSDQFQQALYQAAKDIDLKPKLAFQTIYLSFLGKKYGPKASMLLLQQDKTFVVDRIQQIIKANKVAPKKPKWLYPKLDDPQLLDISDKVRAKYPSITLGIAIIRNLNIAKTHPDLELEKQKIISKTQNLTIDALNTLPQTISYRKIYKEMKVDWHSRRPSPEALIRRIIQGKQLYTINTCVDAYNLAVINNQVSVGAFDLAKIIFPTSLNIATGGEEILLLGNSEPTIFKPGEIYYTDQKGPYNQDFNYRDSQRTAVTLDTKDIILNVDGVYDISRDQVEKTLYDSVELITRYCGGDVEKIGIVQAK